MVLKEKVLKQKVCIGISMISICIILLFYCQRFSYILILSLQLSGTLQFLCFVVIDRYTLISKDTYFHQEVYITHYYTWHTLINMESDALDW